MVLELARVRALDRPVPGVVHAGSELVREKVAADLEELEGEDAHVAELVEQARRELLRLRLRRVRRPSERTAQDAALVHVLDERIEARVAVAPANGEQRELAVETDELLEDVA